MVGRFMAFDGGPGRVTRIRTLTPRSTCSTAMRRSDLLEDIDSRGRRVGRRL